MQGVQHFAAHATSIGVHAKEPRSPPMHHPILQHRLLAVCGVVVAYSTLTSPLDDGDRGSLASRDRMLPVHAIDVENCANEEVVCLRSGGLDSSHALQRNTCAIFRTQE